MAIKNTIIKWYYKSFFQKEMDEHLYIALQQKDEKEIDKLIEIGADIHAYTESIINYCKTDKDHKYLHLIIKNGFDLLSHNELLLEELIRKNQLEKVKIVIEQSEKNLISPEQKINHQLVLNRGLIVSSSSSNLEMSQYLINVGANVAYEDYQCFYNAVYNSDYTTLKCLISIISSEVITERIKEIDWLYMRKEHEMLKYLFSVTEDKEYVLKKMKQKLVRENIIEECTSIYEKLELKKKLEIDTNNKIQISKNKKMKV